MGKIYFTEQQINDIVNKYKNGMTLLKIGEFYNVSRPTIQKVLKGNYPAYTGKKRALAATENQTKTCSKCGKELPLNAFNRGNSLYGRRSFCRECEHIIQNTPERVRRKRLLELKRRESKEYVLNRNKKDRDTIIHNIVSYQKYLLRGAKKRAKDKNLEFNITIEDISIPSICPLLQISLFPGENKMSDNSPTIDRINPKLGYIKGNVWVISNKANRFKNDATLEELELLVANLRRKLE